MGKNGYKLKPNQSTITNTVLFNDYFTRLQNIAMNIYKWDNLPDTVSERFIELQLFSRGYCLYFNDDVIGNAALACTLAGDFDIYGIPVTRRPFAVNGYTATRTNKDSVLIFNNTLMTPTINTIIIYARKLANIDGTIMTNINALKTPCIITCNEKQKLTLKNLYEQYQGNMPVIFGDNTLNIDGINVINTGAPTVFPDMQTEKEKIYNECLAYLGVPVSQIKKERLVAQEALISFSEIEANQNTQLCERQRAVEKINKMFGTNISVSVNLEFLQLAVNANTMALDENPIDQKDGGNGE